jgi:hypothetical protein
MEVVDEATRLAILDELALGQQASQIARTLKVSLPTVHRVCYGWGRLPRPASVKSCKSCGIDTVSNGGIYALCATCKVALRKRQKDASLAVRKAVAIGMLKPVTAFVCVDCGAPATQYEHRDYSKPLVVEPVCKSCNIKRGVAAFGEE